MPRCAEHSQIIFDLGMNNGDDTAHYLSRGFNVVALEANPALCEKARDRFRAEISAGHLKILHAAIAEKAGSAIFYVNLDNDHWSSLDIGWAKRDASRCSEVSVPCVTLSNLFDEFGVPYYLKIDVEGADRTVLEQLQGHDLLPEFVSVEDCRFGYLFMETLAACGYNAFKLLDQSTVCHMTNPAIGRFFSAGSSGPFGNDVPGEWLSYAETVNLYSTTVRNTKGTRLAPRTQWWDIHCTKLGKCSIE